jgi:hypothetical protein
MTLATWTERDEDDRDPERRDEDERERRECDERCAIVCLCGSSRFVAHMAVIAWEMEKLGTIVLSLHLLPDSYVGVQSDHQAEAEGIADRMDELHLRKIDLADRVFVVNVGGYIGDSTRREIAYARTTGKEVTFLELENSVGDGSS